MTHSASTEVQITVGVDTHSDVHVDAALDQLGRVLDIQSVVRRPRSARPRGAVGRRKTWLRWHPVSMRLVDTFPVPGCDNGPTGTIDYLYSVAAVSASDFDGRGDRQKLPPHWKSAGPSLPARRYPAGGPLLLPAGRRG